MNRIFKIIICIFVAVLQLVLMPILSIKGIFPNIVLVGALVLAFSELEEDALILASFGGLILDLGSTLPFGLNTIILVGLVILIRYIVLKFLPEINFLIVLLGVLIFSLLYAIIVNLSFGRWSGNLIFIDGTYSVILGLLFFWMLHRFLNQAQIKMEGQN